MCQVKPVVEIMAPGRRPFWTPLHSALLFALLLHSLALMYLLVMTPVPREEPLQVYNVTVAQAVAPKATPRPKPTVAPDIPLPALRNADPALPPGPAPKAADMPLNERPPAPLKLNQTSYPRRLPTGPPNPNLVVTRNQPGAAENGNPLGVTGGQGDQEGSGSGGGGGQSVSVDNPDPDHAGRSRQYQHGQIRWVRWGTEYYWYPEWGPRQKVDEVRNTIVTCPTSIATSYDTNRYRFDGVVVLRFRVETDGKVTQVSIKEPSGNPEMDQYAIRLVSESTFRPCCSRGRIVWSTNDYYVYFY